MTEVNFKLAGVDINPPVEWRGIRILSRFDNDSIQANTDIDNFTFTNEAAQIIRDHIAAGNVFEGIPFQVEVTGDVGSLAILNGYVKTSEALRRITPNQYSAKIAKLDDLSDISDKLAGITLGLLRDNGTITEADYIPFDYVVEKEFNAAEFAVLAITVYLMTKQIIDETRAIAAEIAQVIAVAAAGVTGPVAAFVLQIALLLIRIAFAIAMVVALVNLIRQLIDYLYPATRTAQAMTFNRIMERVFAYIGYTFSSPIPDMNWLYIPSKPEGAGRTRIGIPNPQDYGYRATEMLDLCKQMFEARIVVDNTRRTVELRSLNDPYWRQQSTYTKPDKLNEEIILNTNQVVSTRLIQFTLDNSDFYTIENYRGTSYEVTTELVTPPSNPDLVNIEGFDEVRIPVALATRKDGLSVLEGLISDTVAGVNRVLRVFGGNPFRNPVRDRVGMMKIGQSFFYTPKIAVRVGNRIPANYRDIQSARYLYDNYINHRSLVANNFYQQAQVVTGESNPFTLRNLLQVLFNKYFKDSQGNDCEMTAVEWEIDSDTALLSYKRHMVYTTNLKETGVEIT